MSLTGTIHYWSLVVASGAEGIRNQMHQARLGPLVAVTALGSLAYECTGRGDDSYDKYTQRNTTLRQCLASAYVTRHSLICIRNCVSLSLNMLPRIKPIALTATLLDESERNAPDNEQHIKLEMCK